MIYTITALYPFLLLFFLLIILQRPALISIPIVLVSTIIGALLVWEMNFLYFLVAFVKSFLVTLDVIYIIAGVLLLLLVLQKAEVFENFEDMMKKISADRRIQAVIVGWLFVGLLEGAAGFGTPGMLAAGILVSIGFRPLPAVIIPLVGGFVATTFGAVGVPITIGINEGLPLHTTNELVQEVTHLTALFHLILGSGVPVLLSCITTYLSKGSFKQGLGIWKFALLSGVSFTIPMYFIAIIFGPEFASIGGSLIAIFIILFVLRKKLLRPTKIFRFAKDESDSVRTPSTRTFKIFLKTLVPYIILVLMLGLSRLPFLPIGDLMSKVTLSIPSILQTEISHTVTPLYSPGFLLILTAIFSIVYFKISPKHLGDIFRETGKRVILPFSILFSTLALINILIYSDNNSLNLPNMLIHLTQEFPTDPRIWPLISPTIGMMGAFVSGSVTVSNLLFSSLQYEISSQQNFSTALTLTLQTIGSSAGNMIAIHNIVTALSVVKLVNKESQVIRIAIIPVLLYVLGAGILGILFGLL